MTDTPAGEIKPDVLPELEPSSTPADAMVSLGFDPALVQAVVVTPTSAIAVAVDYPEPYIAPEEAL